MAKKPSWNNINAGLQINAKNTQKYIKQLSEGKPASGKLVEIKGKIVDMEVYDYDKERKTITLINGLVIRYKLNQSNIKGHYLSYVCECGRSCASLYFADNGDLRCRKCLKLYYPSQMMTKGKKRDQEMALRIYLTYESAIKRYRNMLTKKGAMYFKAKKILGL